MTSINMHLNSLLQIYCVLGILTTSINCQSGTICRKYDDIDKPGEHSEEFIFLDKSTSVNATEGCGDANLNETIKQAMNVQWTPINSTLTNLENKIKSFEATMNDNSHCSHLDKQMAALNENLTNLEIRMEKIQQDKPCNPNPCKYDGKCISDYDDYACKCQQGYLGRNCSIASSNCSVFPAKKNAAASTNLTTLFVGENITYTCNAGYRIVGTSLDKQTLTCKINGTWTAGKAPECESCFVGVKSGKVTNDQMNASSWWDEAYLFAPYSGRLDNENIPECCWVPKQGKTQTPGQWLQVDLLVPTYVTGVVTQGRPDNRYPQWITKYTIDYGNSTDDLQLIEEKSGATKIFHGNRDQNTSVINYFPQPIRARYFRLIVEAWHKAIALRLDYLTC